MIGGLTSVRGALLGTLWVEGLPAFFPDSDTAPLLASGVGLLVVLMYFPGGLSQVVGNARSALFAVVAKPRPVQVSAAQVIARSTGSISPARVVGDGTAPGV